MPSAESDLLLQMFQAAVDAAAPKLCLPPHLPLPPRGRTVVVGAGKAGGAMAQAVEALWPVDAPLAGLVVTRYHHTPPRPQGLAQRTQLKGSASFSVTASFACAVSSRRGAS